MSKPRASLSFLHLLPIRGEEERGEISSARENGNGSKRERRGESVRSLERKPWVGEGGGMGLRKHRAEQREKREGEGEGDDGGWC